MRGLRPLRVPPGAPDEIDQPPMIAGAGGFSGLRYWLRGAQHEWWFGKQTGKPGEWVSLLVFRDNRAEVLRSNAKLGFASDKKAMEWLDEKGYVPADRAMKVGVVSEVPPDPTKVARSRKRARASATSQQPRTRVAPDASGRGPHQRAEGTIERADELDENATHTVDGAVPRRDTAIETDKH
jgi:hypothetical protein